MEVGRRLSLPRRQKSMRSSTSVRSGAGEAPGVVGGVADGGGRGTAPRRVEGKIGPGGSCLRSTPGRAGMASRLRWAKLGGLIVEGGQSVEEAGDQAPREKDVAPAA